MSELIRSVTAWFSGIVSERLEVVLVELLLIGTVVWWVMRFLRGTRGARLIKGVALLLVVVYVVIGMLPEELQWDRIQFLYGKFLLLASVATVVAFQPELRRALIQIGQTRLFREHRGQVAKLTDVLLQSANYLSRNKIGAVVAVERSVGLGELVRTGTIMDAELTASLLNTIFYPGSALHDMGVIIRDGRIAAAGCQFPLADSEDVDPSLGSRHRAALGLAQETDAAVLVVSEETGRISLACDGQLYLGLDAEALYGLLINLLAPKRLLGRRKTRPKAARDQA
ncbi:MAG: diadenylate cyclase CdaA [Planctomycetes bacterium]|nr:diadenylate cyclase CdaA [Planctomycetota bacterium]